MNIEPQNTLNSKLVLFCSPFRKVMNRHKFSKLSYQPQKILSLFINEYSKTAFYLFIQIIDQILNSQVDSFLRHFNNLL